MNKNLIPMIPLSLKDMDGNWQDFHVLLDTGSEWSFMLSEATAIQHRIAIRLARDSPYLIDFIQRPGDSEHLSPCWVEMQIDGYTTVKETTVIVADYFPGVIGPHSLLNRRITIDIIEGGRVTIDSIPAQTRLERLSSAFKEKRRQRPMLGYMWNLPWVNITVKDSSGKWRTFSANVDTGDNTTLSLPPSFVEEFGYTFPELRKKGTPNGPMDARCGDIEIYWQGKPRTVRCYESSEANPPLVGMKLLRNNRIVIDLDDFAPVAQIVRIPRSTSSNKNFLQSFSDRLRNWSLR